MSVTPRKPTRAELLATIHELSCTHAHMRADECVICMRQFNPIIEQLTRDDQSPPEGA